MIIQIEENRKKALAGEFQKSYFSQINQTLQSQAAYWNYRAAY